MTKIQVEREGDQYLLVAAGHATGSPETCAAISGLLYALAGYLEQAEGATVTCRELESGRARLSAAGGEGVAAAFEMTLVGLSLLEQAGPEFVSVAVREN